MSKVSVFVGIPVYGQTICADFLCSLTGLAMNYKETIGVIQCIGDSLVCRARNNIAHNFLKSDCTHLLFLDADLKFGHAILPRLLSHDLPFVAGWYPKKQLAFSEVVNWLPGAKKEESGLKEALHVGTGMMLIRRDVMREMRLQHPELAYYRQPEEENPGEVTFDLFGAGVHGGQYESEDWRFCRQWRELGGRIWVDTTCGAQHLGLITYPLQHQAKLEAVS